VLAQDAEAFARVIDAVAAEGRHILTEQPFEVAAFAGRVREMLLSGAPDVLLVLEDDAGEVVGTLGLHPSAPGVAGLGMGLLARARGRGGGRALLAEGLERARSAGWRRLWLEVFPENVPAASLYASVGFRVEGYRPGHYRRRDGSVRGVLVMGMNF
jgi:[ribosomal protein S18]-alanine N-acetyltransferase